MKFKSFFNTILGIATEILYAFSIMLVAFLISLAASFKK